METRTDQEGRFIFADLKRTRYTFDLALPGWSAEILPKTEPSYDLTARGCFEVEVLLTQDQGSIAGRILPQRGETLPKDQNVEAIPIEAEPKLVAKWGRADAQGNFRIKNLEPGEYAVAINVVEAPMAGGGGNAPDERESRYLPTYYPGVPDLASAQRFRIERSKETIVSAWTLPPQAQTRAFKSRVVWPNGAPATGVRFKVLMPENGVFVTRGKTDAKDGSFSFRGLADLSYRVEVAARRGAKNYYWVETQIPARSAKTTVLKLRPDGSKPRDPEFFDSDW